MIKRDKFVLLLKRVTFLGLVLGICTGFTSIFVSGIMKNYLIFIGGSVVVSSTIIFLFGLFIVTMEAITEAPDNYNKLDQNIHHIQTSTHKLN